MKKKTIALLLALLLMISLGVQANHSKAAEAVPLTSLRFQKIWANVPAGITPPEITVLLKANGVLYRQANLQFPNTVLEWMNLPYSDSHGVAIDYTVEEEPIIDFDEGVTVYTPGGAVETVYCEPSQQQVDWPLQNPGFVITRLIGGSNQPFIVWTLHHVPMADRTAFLRNVIAASKPANFKQPLKDLESYLNGGGTNIIWFEGAQVDEDVMPADPKKGEIRINITFHPDGTIASSNLYYQGKSTWTHFAIGELSPRLARITNSYHQELINIEGTKTWDDENDSAGERPASITIRLLANGTEVASKTVNNAGGWKWLFENLPKYHNGAEIVYTITEDVVNGYSTTIDGYYVKNEYTPGKTNVQVTKAWDDANDQDGKRPESVTIKLFADGMDTGKTLVLNAANSWTGIFTNLDKQKEGKDIVYTVKEEAVGNGYATTVAGDMTKGFTVTNSRTPETVDVEGSKTWDDQGDQDGKRPGSIAIRLYKTVGGMTPVLVDGKDVTPDAGGNWTWSFKNLPKYQGGQLITYSVSEEAVPGYTPTINGYSIINSYVPETTDISVTKVWEDADNQDGLRADDVTVQLLADGKAVDGKTLTLNAGNSWMGMFSGLPVYKAVGQEIVYTVEETPVPHGYANMITGDAEAGFTITNSHVPGKTEIKVEKIWDDENNKDGSRPKSVTIKLLADGTDTGKTLVLTADNQWMGAFTDLDEYREGAKIIYTVHEQPVAGYEVLILEDEAKTGFTVTNSHKPKAPPIPPPPTTGESWGYYTLMAVSLITLGASLCLIRRRKCAQK